MFKDAPCLKIICGAGNENIKEVEKLVYIYAKAGFNMFDICAKLDVLKAAQRGLEYAQSDAKICVSVGLQDDIHLSKAVINKQKCNNCGNCLTICPQNAIYFEDEKYCVDDKKCIGCLRCKESCPNESIIIEQRYKAPHTMLLPILSEKIDCVEYHCSSEKIEDILDGWNKIKTVYKGMLGICLDRSKLGNDKIITLLKEMIKDMPDYSVILQADGKPMSGGGDDYKSTLQTVAFAQIINDAKLPLYIILSGGTSPKSAELAMKCGVNINGVALGSYARKIVKEYIDDESFWENVEIQNLAIQKAKELASELISR